MLTTIILPNYRKLGLYYPNLNAKQIVQIEERGGDESYFEYQSEESFSRIAGGLKNVCEAYNIVEHYTEILFLLMLKNEQIRVRYDAYWQNYNDDLTSKEVAQFLLTYKESKPNTHFNLVAKPANGSSATIKDTAVARWMAEQLYNKIEQREFPLGIFGEKLTYDLFGDDYNSTSPISIENLRNTANRSPRKPTVRLKKLFTELCLFIQPYLDEQTILARSNGALLSDGQANFFFEVLETLGYINSNEIQSEPKDYIYAMFANNVR
jgi:hypothetical protein